MDKLAEANCSLPIRADLGGRTLTNCFVLFPHDLPATKRQAGEIEERGLCDAVPAAIPLPTKPLGGKKNMSELGFTEIFCDRR